MRESRSIALEASSSFSGKMAAYRELVKFRLSFLVAFSAAFGFALAQPHQLDWVGLLWLAFAGFLLSGASVTINQVIEKELDKKMSRTQNRPLPTGRVSTKEAIAFSVFIGLLSLVILWFTTNPLTVGLAFLSMVLYSFVYTPLKRVGPIAVFVGAIPGALPPLLGWTAATGMLSVEALLIFSIQFIWQFPHFWAIAWVSDDDYRKAGFKLLPGKGEKNMRTAAQIMTYTLFLLPLGLLPAKFGITGINSAIVATVCGVLFLSQTLRLMMDVSRKSALRIMFGSFLYLPIVQIAYLLDKI